MSKSTRVIPLGIIRTIIGLLLNQHRHVSASGWYQENCSDESKRFNELENLNDPSTYSYVLRAHTDPCSVLGDFDRLVSKMSNHSLLSLTLDKTNMKVNCYLIWDFICFNICTELL